MTKDILVLIVMPILVGLVVEVLSQLFARWLDAQDND